MMIIQGHVTAFPLRWQMRAGLGVLAVCMAFQILTGGVLTAPANATEPLRLVVLGDSLSAGYELPADAAFPAQLQKALERDRKSVV